MHIHDSFSICLIRKGRKSIWAKYPAVTSGIIIGDNVTRNGQLVTRLNPALILKTLFPGPCNCGWIVEQNYAKGSSRASINIQKQFELSKSDAGLVKKNTTDVSVTKI